MVKKKVTPERDKDGETEGKVPEKAPAFLQEDRSSFWTVQRIWVGISVGACLSFFLIFFLVWETAKPRSFTQTSVEMSALQMRLLGMEKTLAQQAAGRPSTGSPIIWIAFSLLRQDMMAGLPVRERIARLRAVLPDTMGKTLEEPLMSLAQERVWSLGELILKFDAAAFFPRQEKKVSFFGKSMAFLERFFTIWKKTPAKGEDEQAEESIRAFCAQVKAGAMNHVVQSAEKLQPLMGPEGQLWLQEAKRFVHAQEVLAMVENAVFASSD